MNEWEKEFPTIYKLKNPKIFFADLLIGTERAISKFGYIMLLVLIAYTCYFPNISRWIAYRNLFYLLLILDWVFIIPAMALQMIKKNHAKAFKIGLDWISLILFITFSYAISGIINDILFSLKILNENIVIK